VVGAVTFSQPIGYLSKGHDFDGTLHVAEIALDYFSQVGCMPWLDHFIAKNPFCSIRPPGFGNVGAMSVQRLVARYQGSDKDVHDPQQPDFLDKFIEAKNANPETVDDGQVISWLMINLIAGADTTAMTIRSVVYYCLKNLAVWRRLRRELAASGLTRESCPISYKDCKGIPYLDAVVRESLRMLPGVSLPLERYVPEGGYRLPTGEFVPEGSVIGVNPYLVCRDPEVWGSDAEAFRPERWFRDEESGETEETFKVRLQKMNDADLSFGAGSRICIGKSLALNQVHKVVATLAVLYNIELVDPNKEWRVINSWVPRQEGLEVRISKRV
jgi:cytochrome P450